jgi:hypothetical protein
MAATGDHLDATLFIRPPLTARRYVFGPASKLAAEGMAFDAQ